MTMALAIEERLSLVLASFREEVSVADLCRKAQVPESTFRDWRDRFIAAGTAAFEDRVYLVNRKWLFRTFGGRLIRCRNVVV